MSNCQPSSLTKKKIRTPRRQNALVAFLNPWRLVILSGKESFFRKTESKLAYLTVGQFANLVIC